MRWRLKIFAWIAWNHVSVFAAQATHEAALGVYASYLKWRYRRRGRKGAPFDE